MSKYRLKLYLTGRTPRSQQAIDNLSGLLEEQFAQQYELEVVDVIEHPQLAEEDKILATPAVILELPEPVRRVIGDLSDRDQVLLGLDLAPISDNHSGGSDHG